MSLKAAAMAAGSAAVGQVVTAALSFQNQDGSPGKPASPPTWNFDNTAVWNPTVSASGLSATGPALAAGVCNASAKAEGDPTPGVDTITVSGALTVTPEEIATGSMSFSVAPPPAS